MREIVPKQVKTSPRKADGHRSRRATVPLADLDNWLEFLESMLGTDRRTRRQHAHRRFQSLDDLEGVDEDELPGFMGMDAGNPERPLPMAEREVRDIAEEQGFLHWELEFALVFA